VKVSRRRGQLQVKLDPAEVSILDSLLDQLTGILAGRDGDGADALRARLSPAGYRDDPAAEADFRELTAAALRDERDERIAACRAELARGGALDLTDPDAARRWIQVLNDLRLALGTRLEVTEDARTELDPDTPDAELWAVYHWLTAVQDSVVGELLP
jgi:hypothetical protein